MQLALLLVAVFVAGGIDGGHPYPGRSAMLLDLLRRMEGDDVTTTAAPAAVETTVSGLDCPEGQFGCKDIKSGMPRCFANHNRCDHYPDCMDKFDEPEDCKCDGIKCTPVGSNSTKCLPGYYKCDGQQDCAKNEDEPDNCTPQEPDNYSTGNLFNKKRAVVNKLKTLLKKMEGDAVVSAEEQEKRHLISLLKKWLA